ncbi:hypothetical protein [Streptosporangium subroseum]|uniref:hypothetical protein n=1 Tax=Streptosporangium subroseum TaxID=106412 RepID=UPI003086E0F1|nr:hypothetical protein OHB15_50360 [Streptosporangium subroseum]
MSACRDSASRAHGDLLSHDDVYALSHDDAYAARLVTLAELAVSPEVRALVRPWGPPTPRRLAGIARIFGGRVHPVPSREAPA